MNERRVIDALATGACSRAELSRRTGISAPTISKAIVSLSALGLVEERDDHENRSGRPAFIYELARDSVHVIGVSLGPDTCEIRSNGVDCRHDSDDTQTWDTPPDREALIQSIADRVLAIDGDTDRRLLGVGVTVPGAVDHATGAVIASPTMPGLDGFDLARELASRTGAKVSVVAQATGLCLAEQWFEHAQQYTQVVVVDLNDDVSLRCCMAGQTMMSPDGRCGALGRVPAAGDGDASDQRIGDVASDAAFAAAVSAQIGKPVTPVQAVTLVSDGDTGARATLDAIERQLAHATLIVSRLFSPQAIIFHGLLLDADAGLLERVADRAGRAGPVPPLHRSGARLRHAGIAAIVDHLAAGDAV